MAEFDLMHKDVVCGRLTIDMETGCVTGYRDNGTGRSPYMGHADKGKVGFWWKMRAAPASRLGAQEAIKKSGCATGGLYLAKNLGLSMTDAYWIRPEGSGLRYDDVRFKPFAETPYDPNASLGGQMEKHWDLGHHVPLLVKEAYGYDGQQAVNEAFATWVHGLQDAGIPSVRYAGTAVEGHGAVCACEAFTTGDIEFIPAYEVLESHKGANDRSAYENYIEACVKCGIGRDEIQSFMDYQTMTDFII
ncbi:MAG: hypothetical protein NC121_20430, partial [Blautia sp.]|nr:hypothetical protein [Blautia sp.]